jgi:hypothetical protein
MASFKTVNGDYELTCQNFDASGNPTNLGTFTINANLLVLGDVVNTQPQIQSEPFITVAGNNNGLIRNMGLLGQISNVVDNYNFAGLRFNIDTNQWQVSSRVDLLGNPAPGNAYLAISTGNVAVAGQDTQIQFNNQGDFGGAANLNYISNGGFYTGNTSVLSINGLEQFKQLGPAQGNVVFTANASYLLSNPVQSGGTGLYFISPDPGDPLNGIQDELISKTKAIVYSIIF